MITKPERLVPFGTADTMTAATGIESMAKILIYTRKFCGYCRRATRLLDFRGLDYEEIDIGEMVNAEAEMLARSGGRRTVPQIFIEDRHIGGSDDLLDFEADGGLDDLAGGEES
jgi:glutaredoxin 3